ncbi:hypothetical protein VP01_1532g1 [Puccinia sorghi]|uniref:Uncharacterized protein n=1 Tax=Puccinia sorghi TaxID=27349 RepID=A0A0L6VJ45_9BASI|nr:hypothetical protein VP01_1532g1 [Puccinia sorghi]
MSATVEFMYGVLQGVFLEMLIGDFSSTTSEEGILKKDQKFMKLWVFLVKKNHKFPQLRGHLFSTSHNQQLIIQAFMNSLVSLTQTFLQYPSN